MLDEWGVTEGNELIESPSTDNELSLEECLIAGTTGVDIPNEQYHSMDGISGSNLELLAESNKHLDHKGLFNLGESPALTFGTLLHTMVLEPQDLDKNYAVMQKFDGRTKQGKIDKASFIEANKNKICIDAEEYETAENMTQNVRAICGDIIDQGVKEKSYFVRDDDLILKIRPDCYFTDTGAEYDLKSITPKFMDMTDRALERHIISFGYHISAGFRQYVRNLLGMPTGEFYLIFVSTSPGHMVRKIRISDAWIEESKWFVNDILSRRKLYLETGTDTAVTVIDRRSRQYE